MFGYIKPFKPELKIREFDAYKAVYCGLCGELGRSFGFPARFMLSYDFTFVSMLYFSLNKESAEISCCRCHVNPFKKTPCVKDAEALRFGADLAAIMLYHKLCDNISDSGFPGRIGWYMLKPLASSARKKAAKSIPEADEIISRYMLKQSRVEAEKRPSPDEAAEPTAEAMSQLFRLIVPDKERDEKIMRILERFGYFIGRFTYICDALDDIGADLKSGGYNPLVLKFGVTRDDTEKLKAAKEFARDSLYMTIGEAAKAYDLLDLNSFKPILDNIIALGLQNSVREICEKPSKKRKSQV